MYTRLAGAALAVAIVSGCAVGQKFDYANTGITVSDIDNVHSVSVAVLDQREYVLSGNKPESFVGLSRGGFANPFDVTTQSGEPMADEMANSISDGLKKKGWAVQEVSVSPRDGVGKAERALVQTKSDRLLLFTLEEWKTDSMARTGLLFDVTLDVFASDGQKLAHSHVSGKEVSGSSILSANKDAQRWFAAKVTELLNKAAVEIALE